MSTSLFNNLGHHLLLFIVLLLFYSAMSSAVLADNQQISGTVYDTVSGQPIGFVTIHLVNSSLSTLANANGQFRLLVSPGEVRVRVSHVGYVSDEITFHILDTAVSYDFYLKPSIIELPGILVYQRAYDPAQRIIVEAIRRKRDIVERIHDYSYDAYTKLVINDLSHDDSSTIFLIGETQTTAYWERPDRYKEIITARKQSANFKAENNLITVGDILNFNKNRLEIGEYVVVSPTARDALEHYNYYLLDSLYLDTRLVYVLEIEPKDPLASLFIGEIMIADSTYDVVSVDVGLSEGIELPMMSNIRYRQRFTNFESDYWMPNEIRLSGRIEFKVPLPGIPSRLEFEHIASLYSYRFDEGHPGIFDEYAIIVTAEADAIDSTEWQSRQSIPLTYAERQAYQFIDSVENAPKPLGKQLLRLGLIGVSLASGLAPDLFHYNRVEGAYLGIGGRNLLADEKLEIRYKLGYGFETHRWQFRHRLNWSLSKRRKLVIGLEYHDVIVHRPTVISGEDHNSSLLSLSYKIDPFDYYGERGWSYSISMKPVNHALLKLILHDYLQYSSVVGTDYSLFDKDNGLRDNPAIADGLIRSVTARIDYDSRKRYRDKGRDGILGAAQYLQLGAGIEYSSPDLLGSKFDFRRYYVWIYPHRRVSGLGISSMYAYWGQSDGVLPPQRYFSLDFHTAIFFSSIGFATLDKTNFGGNRVFTVYLNHNFPRKLLARSGLPVFNRLPFKLSLHGGAFWSDFVAHDPQPGDTEILLARKAYSEIGVGIGNLTPFLAPFNLVVELSWQLSDHETSNFSMQLDLRL